MKQQRPNLRLFVLIGFCGLVLLAPVELMRAEETPVPSGTPATRGAAEHPSVRAVGVHKWDEEQRPADVIYAQRGDEMWVDIITFRDWIDSLGDMKVQNHEVKDVVLYMHHFRFFAVSPISVYDKT